MDFYNDTEFVGEIFKGLECVEQTFHEKEFVHCNFINCNFSSSSFIDCQFIDCQFENCNLTMIHVNGTNFMDVTFVGSKLIGILWYESQKRNYSLSMVLRFKESFIDYSSFFGMDLRKSTFENTTAIEVDFSEANLSKVRLNKVNLSGATFNKTNLKETNFTTATDFVLDPSTNQVRGAIFSMPEAMNLLYAFGVKIDM